MNIKMNEMNLNAITYMIAYPDASDSLSPPPMIHPFANLSHILHYVIQFATVVVGILSAIATLIQTLLFAVFVSLRARYQ